MRSHLGTAVVGVIAIIALILSWGNGNKLGRMEEMFASLGDKLQQSTGKAPAAVASPPQAPVDSPVTQQQEGEPRDGFDKFQRGFELYLLHHEKQRCDNSTATESSVDRRTMPGYQEPEDPAWHLQEIGRHAGVAEVLISNEKKKK